MVFVGPVFPLFSGRTNTLNTFPGGKESRPVISSQIEKVPIDFPPFFS
jgi:hypothetical protein